MDRSWTEVVGIARKPWLGGAWGRAVPTLARTLAGGIAALLAAERERWSLWLPVGLACGIALYFALPEEPPSYAATSAALAAALAVFAGLWLARRGRPAQGLVLAGLAAGTVAAGCALAGWHAREAAAPVLTKRLGPVSVVGRIIALEPGPKGARLTLEDPEIARLAPARTPKRVRVRMRDDGDALRVGDTVRLRAILMPPSGPAAPGAFDFARDAWFRRLGAVGFSFGKAEVVSRASDTSEGGIAERASAALAELRRDLHARILAAIPGPAGPVASALITGERGDISKEVNDDMRDSGLAHLLSISGLHISLVTGALFFGVRAVLALFPGIALRRPIKKWAAFAALLGGGAYMLLSGATVPTQRAFLMTALVLLAVMVDRSAISMRLVAWAAVAVLLIAPDSLMGPSFQMSFAAVIALVAAYEVTPPLFARLRGEGGLVRRVAVGGAGIALTTLVAGLATAPFTLYHFNQVAVFGLVANLGAVPVTAVWIMPLATLALLLAPLGLEEIVLVPMGWGVEAVLVIARVVAESPGAAVYLPEMPLSALLLIVAGGFWLALWRTRLRLAGLPVVCAGVLVAALARPPDLLVAGDGASFAVRDSGRLVFAGAPLGGFARDMWLRRSGEGDTLDDEGGVPASVPKATSALRCDAVACIYRARGLTVSVLRHPEAAQEDCRRSDVVVALVPLRRVRCAGPRVVVDRFDLWRKGTHALWLDRDDIRVETVAETRGRRPWSVPGRGGQ